MSSNSERSFQEELRQAIDRYRYGISKRATFGEAVSYALEQGGKYVRPHLVYLVCKALGGKSKQAVAPALAIEMIHTYSLVHDDLPCMDNDDLRRGRATVHKAFDEPTALLVGDCLLTDAFKVPTTTNFYGLDIDYSANQRLAMVYCLSQAAGGDGMVLGQALDLHWTKRQHPTQSDLDDIHLNKTGRLIGAACSLGAIAADRAAEVSMFQFFGEQIGLAFQIIDDCLDDREGTGKSRGKDQEMGKLTYLSFMDQTTALAQAKDTTDRALSALDALPADDTAELRSYVMGLLGRVH